MFNIFKTGKEFNKMAMIMNQMNVILTDMELRLALADIKEDDREVLFSVAFMGTKGVDDRMEKYNWGIESKIIIPSINSGYINLMYGYQQILGKMFSVSELLGVTDIVTQITDKQEAYYELEREFPIEFLNNI